MKKRIVIGIVLLVVSVFLITTSNANFNVRMNIDGGSENKQIGESITYRVKLNENIVACNFDITYDNKILEFVGSDTQNLSAAVNGDVVSCIYVDIAQQGTNEFKIKFKVIAESSGQTNIGITNVKFRAKDKETSYVASDIQGVEQILKLTTVSKTNVNNNLNNNVTGNISNNDNKSDKVIKNNSVITQTDKNVIAGSNKDKTIATAKIPQTGLKETTGYLLMVCAILIILSGIFKIKENNLKKIFKAGGVMMLILTLVSTFAITSSVYAIYSETANSEMSDSKIEIKFYDNLITNKKNAFIIINEKSRKGITKEELLKLNKHIKEITNSTGKNLNAKDEVKTSDIIKVNEDSYEIILCGDSNCDGIMCDTDDIMTIVEDYIGKKKLTNEQKIAANLQNTDEILDTDDIMKMINKYLGKNNKIIAQTPKDDIDISKNIITASNYGDYIDYNVDINLDGNSQNDWKIFYNDGENIFIIASDVVKKPERFLNLNGKSEYWEFLNDYGLGFSSIAYPSHNHGYVGASSINKDTANKFMLNWLNKYPNSTLWPSQITAFLMDNNVWSKFEGGVDGAIAIGGPTMEMFISSWTDKGYHPIQLGEISEYGYDVESYYVDESR